MKYFLLLLALCAIAYADKLSDCKCNEDFEARQDPDKGVICAGIKNKALQPCNIPPRPRCVCGDEATGVTSDRSGTWCGKYASGKLLRRWDCLNKEEWDEFKRSHPDSSDVVLL